MRNALPAYLPVVGGLAIGLAIGVFVADTSPAFVGWLFGAGAGLMGGAFVAALATNEALVGRGARPGGYPGESPGQPRSGNGRS